MKYELLFKEQREINVCLVKLLVEFGAHQQQPAKTILYLFYSLSH